MAGTHEYIFEIDSTLIRLRNIMRLNFLENPENINSPFYNSVIIEALIHLNFLLQQALKPEISIPINFTDDIPEYQNANRRKENYYDITTLIRFFRDAACHNITSKRQTRDESQTISFVYQTGKTGKKNSGIKHLCKYDDDIALLMGDHVLYIRRHLTRAYDEICEKLLSLERFHAYKTLIDLRMTEGR